MSSLTMEAKSATGPLDSVETEALLSMEAAYGALAKGTNRGP